MILSTGQVYRGRHAIYRLLNPLHAPTVFKAQVLDSHTVKSEFAVVKTALEPNKKDLRRERNNYLIPGLRSSPYIRTQYDILERDPHSGGDPPQADETATAPLDVNPNNIFLSGIDGPSPIVKLGDLGNMFEDGYDLMRLQCLECRAPEVWRGLGVWHSSDVWSFGITLVHWLSHSTIFGPRDKVVQDLTEAWCIAKIRRLVGPIEPPVDSKYDEEFALAEYLETSAFKHQDGSSERQFITVGTWRQELEKLSAPKVSPDFLDFIEFLLVADHRKRPTAEEALQHPYLRQDPPLEAMLI
ncbi:MAG: hypothetical protein Q9211_004817 [Gyalolechia sp. 1 TL-2023]